jgi:RNA polymerase sigma-B factor
VSVALEPHYGRAGETPGSGLRAGGRGRSSKRAASRELLREYHLRRDRRVRERLIREHLPLVRWLARRFVGRGEEFDDLVQVGSIGLIRAIDRFEPDRGVDLAAYAIPTIAGEMQRHLRDRVWPIKVPRRLRELGLSLESGASELAEQLKRSATTSELAEQAGVSREDVDEALAAARSRAPRSLSVPTDDERQTEGPAAPVTMDDGYEIGEDRALLRGAFRVLDERERRVLHLAFFAGLPQSQIGREVGISQIHVSRLTRRALEKLRAELGPD